MKITAAMQHTMTDHFVKQYAKKYGAEPVVNRHTAKWGWDSILKGMSMDEAKSLVDYYLQTSSENLHSLSWFFSNYDKLFNAKAAMDADSARRARLREESKKRAEEWLARGNTRIAGN